MTTKYFVILKSILPWTKNYNKPAMLVKIDGLNAQIFTEHDPSWQDDRTGNAYLDCAGQGDDWSKCKEITEQEAEGIKSGFTMKSKRTVLIL